MGISIIIATAAYGPLHKLWSSFSPPLKKYKIPVHSALLRICSPVWLTEIVTIEDKMRQRMKYQEVQDRNVLMKYVIRTDFPEAVRSIIRYVYGYHQEITRAADPFLLVAVYKECERLEMDRLRAEILKTLSSPVMNVQPLLSLAHAAEALDVPQLLRECIRILAD
ncbi:gyf domain, partial [Cystoisospora suis]